MGSRILDAILQADARMQAACLMTAAEVACWRAYGLVVCGHYYGYIVYDPNTQEGRAVYA